MKIISRFAGIIAMTLVMNLGLNVSDVKVDASTIHQEKEKSEYISSVVYDYIGSTIKNYEKNVYISQPFYFYDFENGKATGEEYIVFLENDIAGIMYVNTVNGEYSSSYRQPDMNVVDDILLSGKKVAFGYSDGKTLLYCDGKYYDTNYDAIYETDLIISDEIVL